MELARHQVELENPLGKIICGLRFPQDQNLRDPELERTNSRALSRELQGGLLLSQLSSRSRNLKEPLQVVWKGSSVVSALLRIHQDSRNHQDLSGIPLERGTATAATNVTVG